MNYEPLKIAGGRVVPLVRPLMMGVVNTTPDSFSDGGEALSPDKAAAKAVALVASGADIIDIGGESTRPGAAPVDADEEASRLMPALIAIRKAVSVPISIDTRRALVAREALALGAEIINDVSAMADPDMARVVADAGAGIVLMHGYAEHAAGRACGKGDEPLSTLVPPQISISDVAEFLEERIAVAFKVGINRNSIILDPGLGFGKTNLESVAILRSLSVLCKFGLPILAGPSRKRFLKALDEARNLSNRDDATRLAVQIAISQGATILRVHKIYFSSAAARPKSEQHLCGGQG